MNSYDDLQRFKDKTQTHSINFKECSSNSYQYRSGNNRIINQLYDMELPATSHRHAVDASPAFPDLEKTDALVDPQQEIKLDDHPKIVNETHRTNQKDEKGQSTLLSTLRHDLLSELSLSVDSNSTHHFQNEIQTGSEGRQISVKDMPLRHLLERISACR